MNAPLRVPRPDALAPAIAPLSLPATPRGLLRFLTCGSVDDGKSTLIGRLLFEAGAVPDDQLAALDRDSTRHGTTGSRDYALLVDGLAAEREQGITIDVAYRYFSTPRRAFIVADTPGHEQYTRNMATGASTSDLAIILIDASKGVLPQTRRHAYIVAMLGIRNVVLAVNKMDLVDHDEVRFRAIEQAAFQALAPLGFARMTAIPIVARDGDNISSPSGAMPWHHGPTLLAALEGAESRQDGQGNFRFPVQWVNRPDSTFRGFAGVVSAGRVRPGDHLRVAGSGQTARVARIVTADGDLPEAGGGSVPTLVLDREIDVGRGDLLVGVADPLVPKQKLPARLLWMSAEAFAPGRMLKLRLASAEANVSALELHRLVDIQTFALEPAGGLAMNQIVHANVSLDRAVAGLDFRLDRTLGSFILIDAITGETVALGIVDPAVAAEEAPRLPLGARIARFFRPTGERPLRSVVKAMTWRATGSADTFLLSWLFTQSARTAAVISLAEIVTKLVLYYIHERAWARTAFGMSPAGRPTAREGTDGAGI